MQKKYPFKFLEAYTRQDADIFFGREEEIEQLYTMVFQSDLILLYGESGTGKTSLIRCGLASEFQQHEWLPLFIRRGQNLNESLDAALIRIGGTLAESEEDDFSWLYESESDSTDTASERTTLSKRLNAIYLNHFKPIYLIFDQFEELYILGDKAEQAQFIEHVQDILTIEQPIKIILSIREEYLGHLYEFERAVPQLLRKKLRIEPMNLEKVKSVVQNIGSLPQSNVRLQAGQEAQIAEGIFEKIRGNEKTLSIQLPYLQVFLDKLYMQITQDDSRQAEATFSLDALAAIGDIGDVLRNFLDEQVLKIAQAQQQEPDTIWKMLSPFVTLDGTKEPLSAAALAKRLPQLPAAPIEAGLQAFLKGRILRYNEQAEVYEIMHDSLAKQIHAKRSDDEIALLEVQRLIRSQTALNAEAREYFSEKQLEFIAPYESQVHLSPREHQYLNDSRQDVAQKKKRKRQQQQIVFFSILAALAVMTGLAFWAFQQRNEASAERDKAETARIEADKQKVQAQLEKQNAETARLDAEKQKGIAVENLEKAEQAENSAKAAQSTAQSERDKAKRAFSDLQKRNAIVVDLLLENAAENIVQFRYEDALKKIKTAADLEAKPKAVAEAMLEFAFWHNEVGNRERAMGLLDSTAVLLSREALDKPTATREELRSTMRDLLPEQFDYLYEEKYYPKMIDIKGGTFWMGCDSTLNQRCQNDETWHQQSLDDFKIAKYETTWWQYYLFCKATGHEYETPRWGLWGNNPAVNVSWYDAVLYSNWLTTQKGLGTAYVVSNKREGSYGDEYDVERKPTAKGFQLPTEAQWEYAAKGGVGRSPYIYSGSNTIDSVAWYGSNSESRTQAVERKLPNALGLYDMSGNAWEWCWDRYGTYPDAPPPNYPGPEDGDYRILRGGSWNYVIDFSRSSVRDFIIPDDRSIYGGFRVTGY